MDWETSFGASGGSGSGMLPHFVHQKQPYMEILVQPQTKFRFRYRSEMTGKHGSLLGTPTPQLTHAISGGGVTSGRMLMTSGMYSPASSVSSLPATSPSPNYGMHSADLSGSSSSGVGSGHVHHIPHHQHHHHYQQHHHSSVVEGNVNYSVSTMQGFTPSSPSLQTSSNGTKLYPTVKLHNFPSDAVIRCSLVCDTPPYYPHPHLLEMGHGCTGGDEGVISRENCYVEIPVTSHNEHTAVFQGLNIIYVSKKGIRKQLLAKMSQLGHGDNRRVSEERIDDLSLGINLNVVALYYEAFTRDPLDPTKPTRLLCPAVVSNPIQHNKSTQTGELRIVRIDKHASCCTGDEEVFILVEKVDKHNIQVKFYQENDQGQEIWKAYGKFSKLDVHHQYAIVFKTPPYRSFDIDTEVEVQVQLERPSDSATSASLPFIYKPIERLRKMPKRQSSRTGSDSGRRRGPGPSGGDDRDPAQFPERDDDNDPFQQGEDKQGGNNLGSTSSVRQGVNPNFPCDASMLPLGGDPQSKVLAVNVALSVCQGLHSWAETSDLNCILHKLRHLLCIVNEHGDNALHTAIQNQQTEPFQKILETVETSKDISYLINEPNLKNYTPIALAVSGNSLEFVEELIKHNADISIPNSEGDNPLHLAVKANNLDCVKCILQSPNAQSIINRYNYNSMTPLHIAAQNGYIDIVEALCDFKATLTVQEGTYGRTPLHLGVEKEEIENIVCTISLLKSDGSSEIANIQNYRGDTALHCAASLGHKTLSAVLLHFGADPTIENHIRTGADDDDEDEGENGQTVFDVAANDEIRNILSASPEEWAKVYQSCSTIASGLKSTECQDSQIDAKGITADSIFLDSGINITDLNIS